LPSLSARLFGKVLRSTGLITRRFSGGPGMHKVIALARRAPVARPKAGWRQSITVRQEEFAGQTVWHLAPKDRAPTGHLLYYHGGGYVFTAVPAHWNFLARLARDYGIAVTAPLYPLTPEHDASAIGRFALDHYRAWTAHHGDAPFVLGGESAGAGLAAIVAQAARDEGLRLPDGLFLNCPWLDVTGTHPDQPAIDERDPMLTLRGLRDAGKMFAGDLPLDDPRVSPLHGDWNGLPPVLLYGGGDDILVADARRLRDILPEAEYHEGEGMMHVWPMLFFPESRKAQERIAGFVRGARPGKATTAR
jgi:monoterpene epsilon-lactone hydrolase